MNPNTHLDTDPHSNAYSPVEQRVVDQLRLFLGNDASTVYERCGRSMLRLCAVARESTHPSYRLLAAGLALAQEVLVEPVRSKPIFDTPSAVKDFLKLHFAGQAHESFVVAYLDAQHQVIAIEEIFRGTLAQTSVYPREIVRETLRHQAAALLLAHNHPSLHQEASQADVMLTRTLQDVLKLIDVRVLDHVIVAGSQTSSLAERGLM